MRAAISKRWLNPSRSCSSSAVSSSRADLLRRERRGVCAAGLVALRRADLVLAFGLLLRRSDEAPPRRSAPRMTLPILLRRFLAVSVLSASPTLPAVSRALVLPLLVLVGMGCGYSEDEWQAQLAKYAELDSQHRREQQEHAASKEALLQAQSRVAALTDE